MGRAIVLQAAGRGAKVAFCARHGGPELQEVVRSAPWPDGILAVSADVSQEADVDRLFDSAIDAFGRIDAVISNAGITADDLLVRLSVDDWDRVIATNLTGAFLVARRALKEFLAGSNGGHILFIGSVADQGNPAQANYAASKGGLAGLNRTIAKEFGERGILTNLLVPGYIETQMTQQLPAEIKKRVVEYCPLGRVGQPDEVASVALFLVSGRVSSITGQTIHASGGLRL